ncbi:MAG: hypothetical protein JW818_07610, partial [Pirellulales bacterium]|nr:hypothetical protein [Pirellulales bacterium]
NTRDPSLPALTDWLVEQKAWKVLQTDPVTLAEHIASNRTNVLLMLAEAYRDAGQAKLSDAAVLKVLELVHGSASGNSSYHYSMAMKLQSCGFVSAAEREFRKAIELSQATSSTFRRATSSLALMFYEQGDFLKAAQVYEASLKPLETAALASTNPRSSAAMAPALYRERMHTHYALHWASVGDRVKQREALEAALATTSALDSTSFLKALNRAKNLASETLPSADTLIACYQLPDPPPAFREKILKLIKNQVAKTRSEIAVSQRSPIPRNRLAWLVANTEGDLDEALRAAKEATALQPNNSSYHDTLGHCFFAKGDFANAVKSQIRAVEMEPYNLGMRKSLERFRKAYEKETGQPAPKPTPKKQPKLKPIPNRSRASNTYQPTPFGPGGIEIEFFPR